LAAEGVLFRTVWAAPSCSPTRAGVLTGRFGRRYGIGRWLDFEDATWGLPVGETSLPEVLDRAPERVFSAVIGKWHLDPATDPLVAVHPLLHGFDWSAGSLANLDAGLSVPEPRDYFHWEKVVNGTATEVTTYATTETVDDAIAMLSTMPSPWFLFVPLNAAHAPLHAPPVALTPSNPPTGTELEQYDAMVEAMDTEVGRLLAALDPAQRAVTTIVFAGDNGTPPHAIAPPLDPAQSKDTTTEGGVRVPLIVAGPAVATPGSECPALVQLLDLFPTIAALEGLDPTALTDPDGRPLVLDGASLVPLLAEPSAPGPHAVLYAEQFGPAGPPPYTIDQVAVRDRSFKLVSNLTGATRLYAIGDDDFDDGPDLLRNHPLPAEAAAAYVSLAAAMTDALDRMRFEY
ncbi:MAG: sulfatase-like hydrolase/transferase, partial [Myxococcota bacterium]